ncbi:MAG: HAD hydrolase family protein [Lachnospiraceae bacterium]|nr:HAD hydrolase family protein [Lachnospiraceae bacterium]
MIKLGVFDLDGTLLTNEGRLPETFWEDLELLLGRNVNIAIASARPAQFLFEMFDRDAELSHFIKWGRNDLCLRSLRS